MKQIFLTLAFLIFLGKAMAQEPIDVADLTLKIGAKDTKKLHYGFAEGDQIIFNFEETDGKEMKEVEVKEYPSNSKYRDYETKKIENKTIKVLKTGVYEFRFENGNLVKGRVCRIRIQRISASPEKADFNTGIEWVEQFDTTYEVKTETVVTGYNTINKQKSRKVLASIDTSIVTLIDRLERVHSTSNLNGSSVSVINFQLPENTYSPNVFAPYKATEVISWAYSIATGEMGQTWYKDANSKASAKAAAGIAMNAGLISSGYGALALLAIEGVSAFSNPPKGDNIQFQISKDYAVIDAGNSVVASGRFTDKNQGSLTIRLENDNMMDGINVDVKIIAVILTKTWKDEAYTVQEQEPIKEQQTKKIPKVSKKKVPVMAGN